MLKDKTVFVLDAHGLLYQLFHALPPMSSPQGEPVGAIFGFARDLFFLHDKFRPDYWFCAFDMPGPTFRAEIYPEYKANRSEMPEDLRPQIASARELLDAMGVVPLGIPGFEADDLLATLSRRVDEQEGDCVIVSSDKDCRQLIRPHVSLFNLRKQNFYRAEELRADWGIAPEQVVDFQSLVGDSTDNVPGVPLIGPKIAAELLQKFGTLEGVFEHVHEIPGKKRQENIASGKETALMSRELVRLRDDVPIEIEWKEYSGFDADRLRELFRRFGFNSLMNRLGTGNVSKPEGEPPQRSGGSSSETKTPPSQPLPVRSVPRPPSKTPLFSMLDEEDAMPNARVENSFDKEPTVAGTGSAPKYHLVDSPEKFERFFSELENQPLFSFDTETAPIDPRFKATSPRYTVIVGMSFCWSDEEAWYLPFRGPLGAETLDLTTTLEKLRPIMESKTIGKIGQNLKFDMVVLRNAGVRFGGLVFDTMIAHYLLHAGELNHNLDDMAELYLRHQTIRIAELIGTGKKQKRMDEVQTDVLADYAGEDAWVVWKLHPILKQKLRSESSLFELLTQWELPLVDVLAEMEYAGISVDVPTLKELGERFALKLRELEKEIHELAGHEFNVASPKQLAVVLFEELGLKGVKKTQTGLSTDVEVLEELAEKHDLPKKMLEHRQLSKLKGTYVDSLTELIHPVTHRIHSSFNQVSTATGRLSSSDPNLQNIPVRTGEGREIRRAFRPGEGFDLLLSCDYSQIELRVLAHFSEDERLCESFQKGEDIHTRVAMEVFGVSPDGVTAEMRRTAKAVNFGVIYGQTSFGLAKQLGIRQEEAQAFIDGYFAKYGQIRMYLETILDDGIANGYVSTLLGRRRAFWTGAIRNLRRGGLNQAERMAINTVIQGSAADLMKQAMVDVHRNLPRKLGARLLLQIHDELVFEVKAEHAEELKQFVVETMSLGQPLRVPLVVDAELGPHWE